MRWLVRVQARKSPAETGKRGKLWPLFLSSDLTAGWKDFVRPPLSSTCFLSPLPVLSRGVFRSNTHPYPTSLGLPCGLGQTGVLSLSCFHSASHDTNFTHDLLSYKYGCYPKRIRKRWHSSSHSSRVSLCPSLKNKEITVYRQYILWCKFPGYAKYTINSTFMKFLTVCFYSIFFFYLEAQIQI